MDRIRDKTSVDYLGGWTAVYIHKIQWLVALALCRGWKF